MKYWYEKPEPPKKSAWHGLFRAIRTALFWAECAVITAFILYAFFRMAMFALVGMAHLLSR